eukprot:TRINITY_DN21606_c0_g1_i3.p1 TRINITY_DN21606_c0_g1~~TRINITY_DN21606_c0_g1_i3.p1  ORF type:complete len:192 (+),score=74.79 TRINITY_DN21606_c0_g1_i3:183-758(+)
MCIRDSSRAQPDDNAATTSPSHNPEHDRFHLVLTFNVPSIDIFCKLYNGPYPQNMSGAEWRQQYCDEARTLVHYDGSSSQENRGMNMVLNTLFNVDLREAARVVKCDEWKKFMEEYNEHCLETDRIVYKIRQNKPFTAFTHLTKVCGMSQVNLLLLVQVQDPVSYTHLRAHETPEHLVCRLLLEKKKNTTI